MWCAVVNPRLPRGGYHPVPPYQFVGEPLHPEHQIEEENEEKWGKWKNVNNRRMRNNKEIFLSCPPEVASLATPLVADCTKTQNKVTPGIKVMISLTSFAVILIKKKKNPEVPPNTGLG